jgi:DNA-binding response OmpR family regulator
MKNILVIDDHEQIRENIAEILSLAGYHTLTAQNGKSGIELALKEKPDLIVCDIMMPELDGYGVLHLLRKNASMENIPFIFLTAKTERTDVRKGMEMGADDYITKPFDDIELLSAIEVRLKKYDILQAKYENGEKGANELMGELRRSGLLDMKLEDYETVNLAKKTNLYLEGKRTRYLYYLKSGKIKGYRVHEDGKDYITNLYSAGDFIGYLPLLENLNYDDTAAVIEDAELILIPKEEFTSAVYQDIHIATRFIKLIARNVQEKEQRLLNLAYGSLRKRVARGLIDINSKFNTGGGTATALNISREDIAHYIGTATESLIRTLSDFKAEKIIDIKEGKISIEDPEKLNHLLY